jgi:uncharacterized small protein (DUF1192 family)
MDLDDILPKKADHPLTVLVRQDLDLLSVSELNDRIAILESEIQRTRARLQASTKHRAAADALFKKSG